jgi:dTDP-glucose 4,6-dehydratase
MTPAAVGRTINLGSGRDISIGELAELIARLVGRRVVIETDEQRIRPGGSEVERLVADNSVARTLLGWQPVFGLEEGLQRTIEWMQQHLESYRLGVYTV